MRIRRDGSRPRGHDQDVRGDARGGAPLGSGVAAQRRAARRSRAGLERMCGIAGVLDRSGAPVPLEVLRRMNAVISHRGPDDEGHFVDGPVGLANRRLAIIDVSPAGHMPMASSRGSLVITYNGELYNYRELQADLEKRGHQFRSQTDTEVVLTAYE